MKKTSSLLIIFLLSNPILFAVEKRLEDTSGRFAVEIEGRRGFIDVQGDVIIQPRFEEVGFFSEGLAPILAQDQWGFIDSSGRHIIKPQLDDAYEFSEGRAHVIMNLENSFIDRTGRMLTDGTVFSDAQNFSEKRAAAQSFQNGKYGFIDKTGAVAISLRYDYVEVYIGGLARVKSARNGSTSIKLETLSGRKIKIDLIHFKMF